ncbi:MAG: type II/IV secretion system ATPase subunit [Candidatus Woesearchaeota archaeon]
MAVSKKGSGYGIVLEGGEEVLKIDANTWPYSPSIEGNPLVMVRVIGYLAEMPSVARIILNQKRNFNYSRDQTALLVEVATVFSNLTKQKRLLSLSQLGYGTDVSNKYATIQYVIYNLLRSDPVGAYVELKRLIREGNIRVEDIGDPAQAEDERRYIDVLQYIKNNLENTSLIKRVKNRLAGHRIGDRGLYVEVFRPVVSPDFMYTQLMSTIPLDAEFVDSYAVFDNTVTLLKLKDDIKLMYHVVPPELKVTEDEYELIDLARTVLAEHRPKEEEFLEPDRMRRTFLNIGRDLLMELAEHKGYDLDIGRIRKLAKILVRYTIGFGMVEILLQDPKVQDISVNSPVGKNPIFIVHADYGDCVTNIVPSIEDSEGWASKFRLLSARPLDEANPILDTELEIPGVRARVAIISNPLNPHGLAFSLRRHRDKPWTLPLFINNKMIDPLGAGLMSFLIDGARTLLVAGTRSSGKTSVLGSFLVEIMRRYRVITLEDTLELPTGALRDLGYNIQQMKVRSALTTGGTEIAADEGIRTSLRMGDSALIVGEIRSIEAKALYEAMRIGAMANVVAGTLHADSPYGVFDRVVNDLGVPRTSFKATDIIVITNPVKSADGLHSLRRVRSITEVRKHWEDDPLREHGFVDLMKYDAKKDLLVPTDELINGDSETLKRIAGNVREFVGDWDAIWENIQVRAKMKKAIVDYANKAKMLDLLEAPFVISANDEFHRVSDELKEEIGHLDHKRIFFEWDTWVKREIKKKRLG